MYEKLGFKFKQNPEKTFSNYAVGGFFLPKNFFLNGLLKLRFSTEYAGAGPKPKLSVMFCFSTLKFLPVKYIFI